MTHALATIPEVSSQIERVLIEGDLSGLTAEQRVSYHRAVCDSLGLNPLTRPFDYLRLNNKLVLYAKRDATDQLRKIHHVSAQVISRDRIDDLLVVTVRATTPDGRTDESIGVVFIGGLKEEALANAMMKAETKGKRRVTLSICGLGILDETEVEGGGMVSNEPSLPPVVRKSEQENTEVAEAEIVEEEDGLYVHDLVLLDAKPGKKSGATVQLWKITLSEGEYQTVNISVVEAAERAHREHLPVQIRTKEHPSLGTIIDELRIVGGEAA